jgi:hypothetical protein
LSKDAEVFKLVGPVLLKQEKVDALANVTKRMDFINGEMCVRYTEIVLGIQVKYTVGLSWNLLQYFIYSALSLTVLYRKRIDATIKEFEKKQEDKKKRVSIDIVCITYSYIIDHRIADRIAKTTTSTTTIM